MSFYFWLGIDAEDIDPVVVVKIRAILSRHFGGGQWFGAYRPKFTPAAKEIAALLKGETEDLIEDDGFITVYGLKR